ncbi:hypothetical protein BRADI_1g32939v3 [Brachypodium distachyon]|uniref:Uncharacterized protein n=1 Tax=Brachypodium distachyon TaxID=15368 RepID=A0A0Q3L1Q9_BRADI|nr:hypothetical protein BRADI_1g32939v3 [Brachypodium distachyon]PNT75458.1 hypothetical protein BRADI_1g32939v3 [Brachypodium distachyon]
MDEQGPKDGGCDFWYWIDEYAGFLCETGTVPQESPMLIPTGWVVVDAGMAEDNHSRLIQDASERCRGRGKSSFSKKRKEKKRMHLKI